MSWHAASATTSAAGDRNGKTPPTPPASPADRPISAASVPPPAGREVLQKIREEGDGSRRRKSEPKLSKKSSAHRSTNADLPPRQPSDGYQVLDEIPADRADVSTGNTTDQPHQRRHQQQQQQQQPDPSSSSVSDESSSEFDWSDEDADSSEENSTHEHGDRPERAAADGMSSDTESECLL